VSDEEHDRLFDMAPGWAEHWDETLPEFVQKDAKPHSTLNVQFRTAEDRREFLSLVGADPTRARGIWYPLRAKKNYKPNGDEAAVPTGRYPIYVISKGRADTRLTSRALEHLGLDYSIVVEPQERAAYARHIDEDKILTLPFSDLGQGSIPARNWVWDHAVQSGAARHWILDDNIRNFARLNQNENRMVHGENPFIPCEQFVDRYTNVGLAGLHYRGFASYKDKLPPYRLNTRIYSCILINHEVPFRWRGRYNEDTDLSLRVLKAGWVTVILLAYLIDKAATMTMQGGNTDELYSGDGRLQMAESLREQHPDVVAVTEKWGRKQHHVDYSPFRFNKLIPREGSEAPEQKAPEKAPERKLTW
jgi:hypothetical protein